MAKRLAYLRRARHWIANRGWRGFLEELRYRVKLRWQGQTIPGRENGNAQLHPFDIAYRVDTSGLLWGEALATKSDTGNAAYWATGYYGISPSAFTLAIERLGIAPERFTFMDIGCGKGRAMLLALRFAFKLIVGVELSPELAAVARQNLGTFQAPWRQPNVDAKVLVGDATTTALPSGPLILFLYHPFAAPVMKRFLMHLQQAAQAESRELLLLYANPELATLIEAVPGVQPLWRETFPLTAEEGAADRFGSHGEQFSAYRVVAA